MYTQILKYRAFLPARPMVCERRWLFLEGFRQVFVWVVVQGEAESFLLGCSVADGRRW